MSTVKKDVKKCDRCGGDELDSWTRPIERVTLHREVLHGGRVMDLCKFCLGDVTAFMETPIERGEKRTGT